MWRASQYKRQGSTTVCTVKVHKGNEGIRIPLLLGKAERARTAHSGTEEAHRDLIHVYKYLMGKVKNVEPGYPQWCLWEMDNQKKKRKNDSERRRTHYRSSITYHGRSISPCSATSLHLIFLEKYNPMHKYMQNTVQTESWAMVALLDRKWVGQDDLQSFCLTSIILWLKLSRNVRMIAEYKQNRSKKLFWRDSARPFWHTQ